MTAPGIKTRATMLAACLLLPFGVTWAAEKGMAIRAGDLMAEPFIDAVKTGAVTANQPLTIVERRGGWASVEAGGKTGWVRLLNLRLDPGPIAANSGGNSLTPASLLQTGSSGRTVTTGVKGMGEEDIRNATINYGELSELDKLGVDAADAKASADSKKLTENKVDYLKKGKGQ